jgi:hypothetical protein
VGLFDGERRQWRSQPAGPGVRRGLCFARPLVLGAPRVVGCSAVQGQVVGCSAGTGLATAIFGGIKDRARCSNLKTKTDGVVKARSPTQSGHSG